MSRLSAVSSKSLFSAKKEQTSQANELYHLKVLIPTKVVGPIIGKGGTVVTKLENTYHVRIAVSSINDIYPGSNDRVCLISGDIMENILAINDYIMKEVSAMPNTGRHLCFDCDRKINFERNKQVKFLIPQISAAKIIGYRGKTIKWMKSISGSFIQISQSSRKVRLYERCIIVAGDLKNNKKACRMIFSVVAGDTKAKFYKNFSYSNMDRPIPSAFPIGPPFAERKIYDNTEASKETDESCNIPGSVNNKTEPSKFSEFLDAIQMILAENACNDSVIEKAKKAFDFLIRHDILNVCSPVILNFWNHNHPLAQHADDNASTAAIGNAPVAPNVRSTIDGNASVSFSYRPTMSENASMSFNDIPTMCTGNTSVSSNVRPAMGGNASVYFNDIPTMGGNTFVSFSDRPAMGGNTSVSFNDTPTMRTRNASAPFSDTPTVGSYPSDTTNRWENLIKPTVSENLASSFFSPGRNQDAASLHYMPLWNRFSSPLVSINNCAHINMPNYHPGSSELPPEDSHYPMVAGRNSCTNVVSDVGLKFI